MDLSVNNNNRPAFKGMSPENIRRFIPNLASDTVKEISVDLEKKLPNDILQVVDKSGNAIVRCMNFGGMAFPISEYRYNGGDSLLERLQFLGNVVKDIVGQAK